LVADVGDLRNSASNRGTAGAGISESYENIPNIVLMILDSAPKSMQWPGPANPLTLQYRLVLGVILYSILPLPGVPLHSVWTGPVGDVARALSRKKKFFSKKALRYAIKLDELYGVTWSFSGGPIENFRVRARGTSLLRSRSSIQ